MTDLEVTNDGKIDVHQHLMNEAYDWWQSDNTLSQNKFLEQLPEKFSDVHKIAVITGNLNYQVCNGGFDQYKGNGYSQWASEVIDFLEENKDYDDSFNQVRFILEDFLNEDDFEEDVERVLDEIDRRNPDVACYLRECVEEKEERGDGKYGHLDTKFYAVTDQFAKKLNQWFAEQLGKKD